MCLYFRDVSLSVNIHKFVVCYWVSFAKQHGIEMRGEPFQMVVKPHLELCPHSDGLSRRPLANWSIRYFTSDLQKAAIWLCRTNEVDIFAEVCIFQSFLSIFFRKLSTASLPISCIFLVYLYSFTCIAILVPISQNLNLS